MSEPPLSGRRREARRNDAAILESAREVFIADPEAPVSAVAQHAGVGISSLYSRFASKEELLRKLCGDGLELYLAIARSAVADEAGDPWEVFATFMRRIVEADTHTLTINLAGSFTPTEREMRNAALAEELNDRLVARAKAAGVLRADVDPHDLSHIFGQIAHVHGPTPERTAELRARHHVVTYRRGAHGRRHRHPARTVPCRDHSDRTRRSQGPPRAHPLAR